jgi:glycosyltransferase involved in cell wall biosynthesis
MNERIPSRTDSWYRPAKRCLDEMARAGRQFDIVISSYGPPVCHRLGFYAKKRFQAKWMADYRDMWIENHCYRGLWPFTLLETYLERRWVKNADLLSTVSEPLRCALAQKFPHVQTETLYNGYEPRLIDSCAAEKKDPKDSRLRILYTGSVYLHSRNPRPLFEALVQLRKEGHVLSEQFDIRFYSSHSGAVSSLIREYDLGDCVAELGYVSQEKAYALQKGADLLLFLDCVHPNLDGILTGKLFEYLYAPTPILLVGGRGRSSSCQVIAQAEAGFVCGSDVAQIKKVLSEALQRRPTVCKKQDVVQAFSREAQARKLYRLLCALRQR